MISSPLVSIIVLNWNGADDTIRCVDSLLAIDYDNFDVIVIDNGSKDGSVDKIRAHIGTIEGIEFYSLNELGINSTDIKQNGQKSKTIFLIENEANLGFSKGNNVGIDFARRVLEPEYILLLNNDTEVKSDFLGHLVEGAETDNCIAAIGPMILYDNKKGRRDIISSAGGIFNWARYPGYHHLGDGIRLCCYTKSSPISKCEWITGAAMLIRVSTLSLENLNPVFFLGCEDVDLCINFQKRGYHVAVSNQSIIWHKVGASRIRRKGRIISGFIRDSRSNLKLLKMTKRSYLIIEPFYLMQLAALIIWIIVISNSKNVDES